MIEGAERRQRTLVGFPGASHVLSKLPFRTTPRCPVVLPQGHACHKCRPHLERSFLIISSGHSGNAGVGMMMKILDSGVQAEKRLRPFPPLESKLLSLLTTWWDDGIV